MNRYAYVRNNPIKLIDPSGHWSESRIIENLSDTETGRKLLINNSNEEIIIFRNREEFKMKTGATDQQVKDFANMHQEDFRTSSGFYFGSYHDEDKGKEIHLIYLEGSLDDYSATTTLSHELKHVQQNRERGSMLYRESKNYDEERNYREIEARRTSADVWREMGKPDIGFGKWELIFPKIFGTIEDLKPPKSPFKKN